MHDFAPVPEEKDPDAHPWHEVDATPEANFPDSQAKQVFEPELLLKVPASHARQRFGPLLSRLKPGLHLLQVPVDSSRISPAEQVVWQRGRLGAEAWRNMCASLPHLPVRDPHCESLEHLE